ARLDAMPRAAATAAIVRHQAPVLTVPGLLAPEHCARLIALWEGGDRVEGRVDGDRGGRRLLKADVKVRDDVFLPDLEPPTQEIFAIFRARLLPEIEKAFHFAVTRVETLRIGCYDGARRGYFAAHRDNTVPSTLHRRFAMSLNLNADYDGGALRFPEYGGPPYKPDTGGAVIFSCALLHEAMPVTRGRRFGIFGFFFGEAEEAARYARNPSFSTTRIDRPVTAASSPP
ncbi:MAG: 2OG-Fe(II) oxygenase, partial [Alphaproteobacteria bacterium]|nr:2OG-Fe(II) oxygenase [Alphaproteobacteria bacterium]